MKLQKLILAGAYTVAGDVLISHPTKRQVKIADWPGGDEVALTPEGHDMLDELLAEHKKPRVRKGVEE